MTPPSLQVAFVYFVVHITESLRDKIELHTKNKVFLTPQVQYSTSQYTYIFCRRAGYVDPCLREEGTGAQHKDDVDDSMKRILHHVTQILRWTEVVAKSARRIRTGGASPSHRLPSTKEIHKEITSKSRCQHLGMCVFESTLCEHVCMKIDNFCRLTPV